MMSYLLQVKKKLKTYDKTPVVEKKEATAEAPVQRVRTRSQSSDVGQVPLCLGSPERKQPRKRSDLKQSLGNIKNFLKRPNSQDKECVNEPEKRTSQPVAKVEVSKKTCQPVAKVEVRKKPCQPAAKVGGNKKTCPPTAKNNGKSVEAIRTEKVKLRKKALQKKEEEIVIDKVEERKPRHSKRLGERSKSLSAESANGIKTNKEETSVTESPCKKECRIVLQKIPYNKEMPLKKISLAPLFVKKVKKEVVDPEVLKARQKFLQLGLPTATRKKVEIIKSQEMEQAPFFPSIAHIQQRSSETLWSTKNVELSLKEIANYVTPNLLWKANAVQSKNEVPDSDKPKLKKVKIDDFAIEKMKVVYKNVNIEALHKALVQKKMDYLQTKSDGDTSSQPSLVWPDKYRPGSSELQSNDKTVAKLGKWLSAWKRYGEELQTGVKKARSNGDSSDDFVSSDDEEESPRAPVTACLLQGPPSSGKTALIHALASEMDFHVLEINSASKRSGL